MSGNLNPGAFTFIPGLGMVPTDQANGAQAPPAQNPSYGQQNSYQQGGYQGGYNGGYQQGGYGQQQQQYGGYQQGGYGGGYQAGYQQGGYQQNYYNNQQTAPQPRYSSVPPPVQSTRPLSNPSASEQLAALPPKVLSLGGSKPASPAPKEPFVRKESTEAPAPTKVLSLSAKPPAKTVSIGISSAKPAGGASIGISSAKPAGAASTSNSSPAPAVTKEPASTETPLKSVPENSVPAPSASAPTLAAAPATSNKAFTRAASKTDADGILAEAQAKLGEDTLKDLYGGKEIDTSVKQHLNIVFIGHVDAGKSTMGGQILYLCGMVDKRTLEKYEREAKEAGRESWYLSWALDSTSQERSKGITVETGRAYFETDTRRYTILDAPGHKNYVPQMITGASQADVALLVISARQGEFEAGFDKGGQTREHAQLVKTAGVTKLIVVVNKMDDKTVEWSQERFEHIKNSLSLFLKKSAGFNPKDVTFIPVSAFTGANMKERVSKEVCPWNTSPALLEFLDKMPTVARKNNDPFMMPISEKYNELGTIVVGKVESGRIYKGDSLMLMPNKTLVEVLNIYDEVNEELEHAYSGDNIRIRLKNVNDDDVSPGFVLTSKERPVKAVTQFQAQLAILESKNIICAGYSAVMHVHAAAEEVRLVSLLHYLEAKTGRKSKKPPQFAKTGQQIIALIETDAPVCVEKFADYPQLGRFTLRDEGRTVAIGKITKLIAKKDEVPDVAALSLEDNA